jgi:hypothetical protein
VNELCESSCLSLIVPSEVVHTASSVKRPVFPNLSEIGTDESKCECSHTDAHVIPPSRPHLHPHSHLNPHYLPQPHPLACTNIGSA